MCRKSYVNIVIIAAAFCVAMIIGTCTSNGVSAMPMIYQGTQPDGAQISYKVVGDEYFHYCVDMSNNVIQQDGDTGVWKNVTVSNGDLALGTKVDQPIKSGIMLKSSALNTEAEKAEYMALAGEDYDPLPKTSSELLSLDSLEKTNSSAFYTESTDTTTSIPLLVIVIGFDNALYENGYNWNANIFSGDYSVGKYYEEMSDGKFTFAPCEETSAYGQGGNTNNSDAVNDGVVHVKLTTLHDNWSDVNTSTTFMPALKGALAAADQYVDFGKYDKDKDGNLTAKELSILFIAGGVEASAAGSDLTDEQKAKLLWAHQWQISDPPTLDNVTLGPYIAMGESVDNSTVNKTNNQIGTVCHELGHILGLPDLYPTDDATTGEWSQYRVNVMSIMAGGSWGCTENGQPGADANVDGKVTGSNIAGARPTYMDPYCRMMLGYIEPTEITLSGDYAVKSEKSTAQTGSRFYLIKTSNSDEIFLIENRQYEGFDAGLAGMYYLDSNNNPFNTYGGIVVWHVDKQIIDERWTNAVDDNTENTINTFDHRPGIMLAYYEDTAGTPQRGYPFFNTVAKTAFTTFAFNTSIYDESNKLSDRKATGITIVPDLTNVSSEAGSVTREITVHVTMPFGKPMNLAGTSDTEGNVSLTWTQVQDAGSYKVYRADANDHVFSEIGTVSSTASPTFADTGRTPGKQYEYKAVSVNSSNTLSDYSDVVTIAVKIAAPANVTATAGSTSAISLTWDAVPNAATYDIYRSASLDGTYVKAGSATAATFTDSGLSASTTYYYKIKAVGEDVSSDYSTAASATTSAEQSGGVIGGGGGAVGGGGGAPAATAIEAPTGLAAAAVSSTKISLTWSPSKDAASYQVYMSKAQQGTYAKIGETSSAAFTVADLVPDTTYYFKVTASGTDSKSGESVAAGATTWLAAPEAFSAKATGAHQILLAWKAVEGAAGYKISRAASEKGTYTEVASTKDTSYLNKLLTANKYYYYKVQAYSDTNSGEETPAVSAKTKAALTFSLKKISSGVMSVRWIAKSGAVKYQVSLKEATAAAYQVKFTGTSGSHSCSIKKIVTGNTYLVRMRYATMVDGEFIWSNWTLTKPYLEK